MYLFVSSGSAVAGGDGVFPYIELTTGPLWLICGCILSEGHELGWEDNAIRLLVLLPYRFGTG